MNKQIRNISLDYEARAVKRDVRLTLLTIIGCIAAVGAVIYFGFV